MGKSTRTSGAVLLGLVSLGLALASCTSFSGEEPPTDAGVEAAADAATGADAGGDAAAASAYAAAVRADGPVLHWRLGEASGPRVMDATSKSRDGQYESNGVLPSQPSLLFGDPDLSVRITAGSSIARKADPGLSFAQNRPFAIECWFKLLSKPKGTQVLVARMQDDGALLSGYSLRFQEDGRVYFQRGEGSQVSFASKVAVALDVPHHVVGVYDSKAIRLYVDGVEEGFSNQLLSIDDGSLDFTVGRYATGTPQLDAFVDEVAVYDYALPADRVNAHYAAGAPRTQ